MKKLILLLFIPLISCEQKGENYKNVTSSKSDIDFYKLVKTQFNDDVSNGNISIPDFLKKNMPLEENNIFNYSYFDDKYGYLITIDKLESRNTKKLTNKEYVDISNNAFKNVFKGDLTEVEKALSPTMKNVKVVEFKGNLIISDKYFIKRVSYFQDKRLEGTVLENVICTNFHFVTLHNNINYRFNINYYGDDKGVSELVGLFNCIAGSISFN